MLFPINIPAGPVLHPGQSGPVPSCKVAVGLQTVLGGIDPSLLALQVISFSRPQLAGLDPLLDARLLALLPGVDARIVR